MALVLAPPAYAGSTTIGQLFAPTDGCSGPTTVLQTSVAAGTPYVVPAPGVITSWSFQDGSSITPGLKLKVARLTPGGYAITAEAVAGQQIPGEVNTYPASIAVNAGEIIGTAQSGSGFCLETTGAGTDTLAYTLADPAPNAPAMFSTEAGVRIPVSALIVFQPGISSISPSSGPSGGGTFVTINGHDFSGASAVSFGGRHVPFLVNSDTNITAAPFPAGAGQVDVRVTTPGGISPLSSSDRFSFTACVVPSLKGKKLAAATHALKRANCRLGKVTTRKRKRGKVKRQSPKPGTVLPAGANVSVTLG
jgi:hypothetical protein